MDRSGDLAGREMIRAVAEEAEPGATVVHRRSSLLYMVCVEERRRDLQLLDPREPHTREEAARFFGALHRSELYLLEPDPATISGFQRAGYEVAPTGEPALYRVRSPETPGR